MVQPVAGRISRGTNILIVTADDLDPVSIGILDKSDVPHTALCELLLEGIAGILKSLASGLNVIHRDSNVTKSAVRLGVTVDNAVVGIILGAMVMSEFQDTVAISEMAFTLERLGSVVGKEVKRELVVGEINLIDLVEAQELVKFH